MVTDDVVQRGDVFLISLNPTQGGEIQRTRPCVVVSPNELNAHLQTFIVAPMTSGDRRYPFRLACRFQGRDGYVILDQIRVVDRERLVRHLGRLPRPTLSRALTILQEMFAS